MSISHAIAPHLPYLRRFARALAGNQKSGDAYVVAALEALVADPGSFDQTLPPKAALYRHFIAVWTALRAHNERTDDDVPDGELSLAAMTPPSRQAFLLTTVEGFDVEDAAIILGKDVAEVRTLLARAGEEIISQVATEVLIIEDEPIIAMDLEALVESLGHRVVGVARTHSEALDIVSTRRPGLVLADIQLADGSSGLDAVNDILDGFDVPVIFVTAYPERLLTGDRPEPAFLITKPFQTDTLKAVISQALFFRAKAHRGSSRIAASV